MLAPRLLGMRPAPPVCPEQGLSLSKARLSKGWCQWHGAFDRLSPNGFSADGSLEENSFSGTAGFLEGNSFSATAGFLEGLVLHVWNSTVPVRPEQGLSSSKARLSKGWCQWHGAFDRLSPNGFSAAGFLEGNSFSATAGFLEGLVLHVRNSTAPVRPEQGLSSSKARLSKGWCHWDGAFDRLSPNGFSAAGSLEGNSLSATAGFLEGLFLHVGNSTASVRPEQGLSSSKARLSKGWCQWHRAFDKLSPNGSLQTLGLIKDNLCSPRTELGRPMLCIRARHSRKH